MSLSADVGADLLDSRVVLGCSAARIILGGQTTATDSQAVPVVVQVVRLKAKVKVGVVKDGCSLPGVRVVAVPEAEPAESRGLVITATERPDGSWKILRVQSEIQPAQRPAMIWSILSRETVAAFDLTK